MGFGSSQSCKFQALVGMMLLLQSAQVCCDQLRLTNVLFSNWSIAEKEQQATESKEKCHARANRAATLMPLASSKFKLLSSIRVGCMSILQFRRIFEYHLFHYSLQVHKHWLKIDCLALSVISLRQSRGHLPSSRKFRPILAQNKDHVEGHAGEEPAKRPVQLTIQRLQASLWDTPHFGTQLGGTKAYSSLSRLHATFKTFTRIPSILI
ncbi:hypothetical protein BJ508DRAFT_34778 [Ascobolus immersus RN42]|uniref:Secreted protein n=1 Tax=Ascobolus immersus RN42 TaxID=1160509 RepID=A0A3N4HR41_ASCIM|nr:hypothetical protein BJ508DRAFT_34778 [Ascobolus immersus RN42]